MRTFIIWVEFGGHETIQFQISSSQSLPSHESRYRIDEILTLFLARRKLLISRRMAMAVEGGGSLSDLYSSSKRLSLKIRDALERLERLEFSSASSSSLSSSNAVVGGSSDDQATLIRRDISQIQSLCADMDRLWRSIASKPQRDLWKRFRSLSLCVSELVISFIEFACGNCKMYLCRFLLIYLNSCT